LATRLDRALDRVGRVASTLVEVPRNQRAASVHCRDMIHDHLLVLVVLAAACDGASRPPPAPAGPPIATIAPVVSSRPPPLPTLLAPTIEAQPSEEPEGEAEDETDEDIVGLASGDRDGGHVADDHDRCPDAPEDVDGFEDTDGCPDVDVDVDPVLDVEDRCPDPSDGADLDDTDGCPG